MGGAVKIPGNLRVHGFTDQQVNTKAEWNSYIDPVAARFAFQTEVPIRLVPLDAPNKVPLTIIQRLHALTPSPLQAFAERTLNRA